MNHKHRISDVRTIFVPPPIVSTLEKKKNYNKDPQVRKRATDFYLKKAKDWLKNDDNFKHTKKNLKLIESKDGEIIIYNLLRKFVKSNKAEYWYLRSTYYDRVKDFLRYELGKEL
jgi:hypothetical protein